jgi:iron-sulfur cluster repair protein YtfE (RIC family)
MQHSFKEIVEEIVAKHHSLLRRELPKITDMLSALSAQCTRNDSLCEAEQIYKKVRTKIETHLQDEELSLFPTGIAIESGKAPPPCEMDLIARLEEMEKEHDGCSKTLTKISDMIADAVPASELREQVLNNIRLVQEDLLVHVEKENSQVHPRFLELISATTPS